MTGLCRPGENDEIVELYFYDELAPSERADAEVHFAFCSACRESLADLRAIEAALASRAVDAPEDGWRGFMTRLDARLDREAASSRTHWWRLAAAIALVAGGAAAGWMLSRVDRASVPQTQVSAEPQIDRALADAGGAGLERARAMLAGLAQKDSGEDWALEHRMAATLLPEVQLIRQMAADRGRSDLTDILIDVETLLIQASFAEPGDPETLARLRGMIDRRDLLVRLSMATGGDRAGAPASRRGI